MRATIAFEAFQLERQGRELNAELRPGSCMGVFGPSGSGKTAFLRAAAGLDRIRHGDIRRRGEVAFAGEPAPNRKMTPETWSRKFAGPKGASRMAESIAGTGLWNERKKPLATLNSDQWAAAELLSVLASKSPILVIDGHLDRLDPWALDACESLLSKRLHEGATALIATNRAEWVNRFDLIAVWRQRSPVFLGTPRDLERCQAPVTIEVETQRHADVRPLCEPFDIRIEESGDGMKIEAKEDQALVARMLLEGYGDVRATVVRARRADDVLRSLIA